MRNRVAWGLVAILAVVLLGGVVLAANYQSRLPEGDRWVRLLPKSEWGFGPDSTANLRSILAQLGGGTTSPARYRLGIFTVRVERSTPVVIPPASTYGGWGPSWKVRR
jgi:hypothetical protein